MRKYIPRFYIDDTRVPKAVGDLVEKALDGAFFSGGYPEKEQARVAGSAVAAAITILVPGISMDVTVREINRDPLAELEEVVDQLGEELLRNFRGTPQ